MKCCKRFISGKQHAPTAKALMQSRYSAYVKQQREYLINTMAGRVAEEMGHTLDFDPTVQWMGLKIHEVIDGQVDDDVGEVRFSAYFKHKNVPNKQKQALNEHSVFHKIDGRWLYVDRKS